MPSQNERLNNSWNSSLDDWLEEDLKQNQIQCDKNDTNKICSLKNIVLQENKTPLLKPIQLSRNVDEQQQNLIPIMKVYSLLNSIRQSEQLIREKQHKKRLHPITPSPDIAPPSPSLSADSLPRRKRGSRGEPVDLVIKRQRNTDAARRSRMRKVLKMESLEKRVEVLRNDNERLRVKVAVLGSEVNHAAEKEKHNIQRVLELEAQLANAHQQLVKEYHQEEKVMV
ncbi:uncharacterized protein B0P05DRAFT_532268 [Gilbertella persicaria]|uniref:uncharacterized protein n=1 Tax=Gilbertella persicaria TaxID=101096 RepID=UPI00221F5BBA|nr:uncharacterized protein B0P05DRAFT_532268 [Gilbertella persicaria]KAI8087777.1 hypothetical protein B0P05DRAFT_532268 [Gilbertella persicaria]